MKKEYEDYLKQIKELNVRNTALDIGVSEDLLRKYFRGEIYPRLPTAVKLETKYKIECEFWIIHSKTYKPKGGKQ